MGKEIWQQLKIKLMQWDPHWPWVPSIISAEIHYVSESKHEILQFLSWNLMHFFWNSTQFE